MTRFARRPITRGTDAAVQGLSILTVLIGIALLAVLALFIFAVFAVGTRALALAGAMNTALGLAEESLVSIAADPCRPPRAGARPAEGTARTDSYRREVSIVPLSTPRQWQVTVTINWAQGRRSLALTTLHYIPRACELAGR